MKKVMFMASVAMVLGFIAVALNAASEPSEEELKKVADQMQHGEIRWLDKVIVVQGTGVPNVDPNKPKEQILRESERAAEADALRKALEMIKGVQVTSEGTAGSTSLKNAQVLMRVQGMLQGHKRLKTKYYKDLGVDMVVAVSLDGPMGALLVPRDATKTAEPPKGSEKKFSGLVIDARDVAFQPALAPVITDENAKPVYFAAMVADDKFQEYGAVGYSDDIEKAKTDSRVGKNPLVIKAKETPKDKKSDLVIASADAKQLTDEKYDASFLKEGRVIVVLGKDKLVQEVKEGK